MPLRNDEIERRLRAGLDFTAEDLAANRGSRLTPRQRAQFMQQNEAVIELEKAERKLQWIVIAVGVLPVCVAGGFYRGWRAHNAFSWLHAGGTLLAYLATLLLYRLGSRRNQSRPRLRSIEGVASVERLPAGWFIRIGAIQFKTHNDTFVDGVSYRVYFIELIGGWGRPLSAEILDH